MKLHNNLSLHPYILQKLNFIQSKDTFLIEYYFRIIASFLELNSYF